MDKPSLRLHLKALRRQIAPDLWQRSQRVCAWLSSCPTFRQADQVLTYVALAQEIDLGELFVQFPTKTWGIPRCVGKSLVWHRQSLDLVPGPYGIHEPRPDSPLVDPARSQLVLVPTLGCDWRGYRLGYGGGYYDRFLTQYPLLSLGVMTSQSWLEDFPVDPWDQKLGGVVTEAGLCWFVD
ncbi:5-formyltetrahydrofolate cyclo-ligase [Candidatus Cyanaurora vandensis]|uniref:5-formyltetrahydrofolate cyclo-ligase n=1 Tax=Candidatus Cyanaurora vandensis TaxID=2714958 RepID=UPI00257AEDF7|nr:5-formyltetrahydrofolate cyclo-ligase [Candidatus Cyanaurora vandensis]